MMIFAFVVGIFIGIASLIGICALAAVQVGPKKRWTEEDMEWQLEALKTCK